MKHFAEPVLTSRCCILNEGGFISGQTAQSDKHGNGRFCSFFDRISLKNLNVVNLNKSQMCETKGIVFIAVGRAASTAATAWLTPPG